MIEPGSPEWQRLITPSKVAAILGVSRYESPYSLWHRMKGRIPPEPDKDEFRRGHAFEPAMAYLWKTDPRNTGWQLSPGEVQMATDQYGFPAVVTLDRRARRGKGRRVVEFKTARDLSEWGDFFTDEAPADYVAQVQAQMLFTGWTRWDAHLMVLGPFFDHHLYVIPYDENIGRYIVAECALFWQSLVNDEPPPLDNSVATYEAVRELHPDIDPDLTVQVPPDLVHHYRRSKNLAKR